MGWRRDLEVRRARFVHDLTDAQLALVERGLLRRMMLFGITHALPRKFRPEVGGDIDGVLELRFTDPEGGDPDRIQLVMRGGRCRARRNGTAPVDASATMHLTDLVRLAAGAADGGWLAHDGRVVLTGDPFLFVRFPSAFGLRTRPIYAAHRGPDLRD